MGLCIAYQIIAVQSKISWFKSFTVANENRLIANKKIVLVQIKRQYFKVNINCST